MSHKKRILFVDDEPRFLDGLRRLLRSEREIWEMWFVQSADEALDAADKVAFDTIVADVVMPGKDGLELLALLHHAEQTMEIPVIIVTAVGEQSLKRRALDLGATDLLTKPVNREDLVARLRSVLRLKSYQDELKAHNDILERKVKERTGELEDSRREIIWRLAKAGEYRDDETGNHIVRVGCYCRALSEELGTGRDFVEEIFLTSPLHDIGKIGIRDEILLKPGALTPAERKIMERHCAIGKDILTEAPRGMKPFVEWRRRDALSWQWMAGDPILKMASTIAMTHHERWDGQGYPMGLAEEKIPLESRIVTLSDVYDALCSERPYKPAYPEQKTLSIMKAEVGRHFDPAVCAAFEKVLGDMRSIRAQFSDATAAAA